MRTKTLKQEIAEHNARVENRKTFFKTFIGGGVSFIIAWELGGFVTDMIINLINK